MRFLFVDRIIELIPGKLIRGIKHITADDPFLVSNSQGQSCFAPSLIGETLGQLAAWNVMVVNDFSHRPVAGVVSCASLHRSAMVGETLLLESFIDRLDDSAVQYHSIARVGQDVVFTVDGALGPLLPMSDFISDAKIRRQFAEINRPGDWLTITENMTSSTKLLSPQPVTHPAVSMTFDRILASEPGVFLLAEKRITRSAPWFPDHFPFNPVLPMTVLLECKLNLAQLFVEQAQWSACWEVERLQKIKMNGFVYPGDVLQTHVSLLTHEPEQLIVRYRSEVAGKRVCVVDIVLRKKGY